MNFDFPVEVKRQPRKSISFKLNLDGSLLVKAPYHVSSPKIQELINIKEKWIKNKRLLISKHNHYKLSNTIKSGIKILYLGQFYTLKLTQNHNTYFEKDILNLYAISHDNQESLNKCLDTWYFQKAQDILTDRCEHISQLMSLSANKITVKRQKSRWGSCSSLKNINLNYHLIKAPLSVIDYVIIHEFAHLVHMNHSSQFWELVKSYCPDYKSHIDWLRKKGIFLLK